MRYQVTYILTHGHVVIDVPDGTDEWEKVVDTADSLLASEGLHHVTLIADDVQVEGVVAS